MSYRGRIHNGMVVFDPPADLPEGLEVDVHPLGRNGDRDLDSAGQPISNASQTLLERYADLVGIAEGLPADFAANHDHYVHGTPKRDE